MAQRGDDPAETSQGFEPFDSYVPLGLALLEGKGVPQDEARAVEIFKLSYQNRATDGLAPQATTFLGQAYWEGRGVPPDAPEAVRWFEIAVIEDDNALARLRLAEAYRYGVGAKPNLGQAQIHYRAAAALSPKCQKQRDEFERWYREHRKIRRRASFGVAVFIAAATLILLTWPLLPVGQRLPALLVLAASAIAAAYLAAPLTGGQARNKIILQFDDALHAAQSPVRIGGRSWIIVNGEFYHLDHDSGGRGKTFKPETTHNWRHARELGGAKGRRDGLISCGLAILVCAAAASFNLSSLTPAIAGVLLAISLALLAAEYLYWRGVQVLGTAMALDPDPANVDLEAVKAQKAHGGADNATEAELLGAAGGETRVSKLDDQEF